MLFGFKRVSSSSSSSSSSNVILIISKVLNVFSRVMYLVTYIGYKLQDDNIWYVLYFSNCRYKTGLVVLNGLLCIAKNSEQEIITQYGQDAGIAFWLLGELNR